MNTSTANAISPSPLPDPLEGQSHQNRPLYDHKNNRFNRLCVEAFTTDYSGTDGANHAYRIEVYNRYAPEGSAQDLGMVASCDLQFQNGGLKEVGANGITDQALLAVVLDRMRGFNDGPYRCRENSIIITKLEEALMWMEKRANDRARRNVEGERLA
jgi:hypothetical protein